jgi:hypothetical protein
MNPKTMDENNRIQIKRDNSNYVIQLFSKSIIPWAARTIHLPTGVLLSRTPCIINGLLVLLLGTHFNNLVKDYCMVTLALHGQGQKRVHF